MQVSAKRAYDHAGKRKYLTRTEGQKFIEHAANLPQLRALFCFTLYYTGCRISEALNISQSSLDMSAKVVCIQSLKKRGLKQTRRIPIPEFLANALGNSAVGVDVPVWSFSRTTGWRIVKSVMIASDIFGQHATAKGLRHGFGVRGALEHIPISLIQNWMGHSDPATTAIYLDVRDEEERVLMEKMW